MGWSLAICSLESGLSGMLYKEDLSDDDDELTDKLKEGQILTCKIKSIVKDTRLLLAVRKVI
ncbi:putative nucleic acid-binding protein [Helianthus annuus]|nr:putative nucleic acid-binding protein [Helianthus annuus]